MKIKILINSVCFALALFWVSASAWANEETTCNVVTGEAKELCLKFCEKLNCDELSDEKPNWFDFQALCGIPRSQQDYLELTKQFHTLIVSGLHVLNETDTNLVRSLVKLIDILYDQQVRLIIQAEKPIEHIYPQGRLTQEFKRTISRIKQMSSSAWSDL